MTHSASDMLALVNDIPSYPDFLHWCNGARIEYSDGAVVEAALDIGIRGISKTMRTRNVTDPGREERPASIRIEMLDGPLKHLSGVWSFAPCEPVGCDISLRLDYETHKTPFGMLLRALFDEIARSQLNAFIRRADALAEHG